MAAGMRKRAGGEGLTLLVFTRIFNILGTGLRRGHEGFTVNRSLPAKVKVWISDRQTEERERVG